MSRYDELRLRGNPVAAFAVLRKEGAPLRGEAPRGKPPARPKTGPNVQDVLGRRLEYKSEPEYHRALRIAAAADREEIATQTENTTEVELCG